jgi:hypothetical protein
MTSAIESASFQTYAAWLDEQRNFVSYDDSTERADWLADNAPGHFHEPDYAAAAAELGLSFDPANFEYDSNEGQQITESAEADMTNTERGWLLSWEWSVDENDTAPGPKRK